ncbi:hypothetical protein E8P82_04185 [Arthrobacter echini]|uniref:Uncharacterized protein n=1 Tax=Arthrobacter echini TaxID=1529066 RepID=A0A4S5E6Y2_9MICC|nr:hypothetical protein [Arthrobacter echini]THJ67318.1 hypothetical protein E8P82_04185 [Arthrobacter echini]
MLWWMWIVLWALLVLAAAIFLVVVGFRVFRSGARTITDFGAAMDRMQLVPAREDTASRSAEGVPGLDVPAVFSAPDEVRAARDAAALRRAADRRSRRVERRVTRRQPQLLRDMPHL